MYKYAQTQLSKFVIAGICLMFACVFAIRFSNSTTSGADTHNHFNIHRMNYVELEDQDWYMKYNQPIDKTLKLNTTYTSDTKFNSFLHSAKNDADSNIYNVNTSNQNPKVYQLMWIEAYAKRYTPKPFAQNFKLAIHRYKYLQNKQ